MSVIIELSGYTLYIKKKKITSYIFSLILCIYLQYLFIKNRDGIYERFPFKKNNVLGGDCGRSVDTGWPHFRDNFPNIMRIQNY